MYVDELPKIPKIHGYKLRRGIPVAKKLTIGMYHKKWRFHRDLAESSVFVYGKTKRSATFPGPTIEALQGVATHVEWRNHLPKKHILPWDPTVPTAIPKNGGVPTVVHLHAGVTEPESDGSSFAWFTAGFKETGPYWSRSTYRYLNMQRPGNLWYHDHALGLTRQNLLAGLVGPYVIRNHTFERPMNLPCGSEFDRHLIIADRSFNTDGSIYMNSTGNDPTVHPQWQPEYFGDTITVNGKAWPFMNVQRRKYRFRVISTSNARYFNVRLSNGMNFTVVGSDASYLPKPVATESFILSPAETFDVVVDFSSVGVNTTEIEVTNDAPYPYPDGTPTSIPNNRIMKFIVEPKKSPCPPDTSTVPANLIADSDRYPSVVEAAKQATLRRYIVMYEYWSNITGEVTHLYINGKRLEDPVSETPKLGSTEIWEVINLTPDDHPLHLHLVAFQALKIQKLTDLQDFTNCMTQTNDAEKCNVDRHLPTTTSTANNNTKNIVEYEKTWKNIVKIETGSMTTVVVKFDMVENNGPFPFDATAEPGYVYHCHILDHEDNSMIRPFKLLK
ncbi:Bilirubin oxidase [Zostera marina]|uniref:Bilirubin oxidase n=1 Tax=Zostera marina TaxID=29655 RepID=A0A0K9NKE3_ZOSMR|nr:Bilirubin oxidase [Zostera marina]